MVHVLTMQLHARKLCKLHAKISVQAIAIADSDNTKYHTVGFDEYDSINQQKRDTYTGGEVLGLEDVVEMAKTMANCAGRVAECKVPPTLFPE